MSLFFSGRTIEFTFDFSQMPIIGYRCSSVSSASIRSLSVGSTCSSGSSGATSGSSTTTTSPSSSLRERGLAWWGVDGGTLCRPAIDYYYYYYTYYYRQTLTIRNFEILIFAYHIRLAFLLFKLLLSLFCYI